MVIYLGRGFRTFRILKKPVIISLMRQCPSIFLLYFSAYDKRHHSMPSGERWGVLNRGEDLQEVAAGGLAVPGVF
jgi:hypothetical protein